MTLSRTQKWKPHEWVRRGLEKRPTCGRAGWPMRCELALRDQVVEDTNSSRHRSTSYPSHLCAAQGTPHQSPPGEGERGHAFTHNGLHSKGGPATVPTAWPAHQQQGTATGPRSDNRLWKGHPKPRKQADDVPVAVHYTDSQAPAIMRTYSPGEDVAPLPLLAGIPSGNERPVPGSFQGMPPNVALSRKLH